MTIQTQNIIAIGEEKIVTIKSTYSFHACVILVIVLELGPYKLYSSCYDLIVFTVLCWADKPVVIFIIEIT